jgi:sec-independent protein translocase protein TatA
MFGLGAGEIFLILAFALIFIGPKKLPELARSLGKGVREFQNAKDELLSQVKNSEAVEDDEPVQVEHTEAPVLLTKQDEVPESLSSDTEDEPNKKKS